MTGNNNIKLQKISNDGYTMVELLVAVAVFALAFVAITAIFVGFSLAQSRAAQGQRLLSESNYIFEAVAREIRMNRIDYDCGCSGYDPAETKGYICLVSETGAQVHFNYDSDNDKIQVWKDPNGSSTCPGTFVDMNPDFMSVTAFTMETYPVVSPLSPDPLDVNVYQPLTTINMTVEAGRGSAQVSYDFQTAVTSRYYGL